MLNMLGDTESQGEDGSRRNEGGARQPAHTSLYLPRRLSHLAHLSSLHVIEIPNNIFEADTYGLVQCIWILYHTLWSPIYHHQPSYILEISR